MISIYKLFGSSKIDFKLYLQTFLAVKKWKLIEEMYNISRFDKAWTVKRPFVANHKRVFKISYSFLEKLKSYYHAF